MWDNELLVLKATTCPDAVEFIRPLKDDLVAIYSRGDRAISVWKAPGLNFPTHTFKTGLKEPIIKFDADADNTYLTVVSRDDNKVHFYGFQENMEHRRGTCMVMTVDQNDNVYAGFTDPDHPTRIHCGLGKFEPLHKEPHSTRALSTREFQSHIVRKTSDAYLSETIPFPSLSGRHRDHIQMTPRVRPKIAPDLGELGPPSLLNSSRIYENLCTKEFKNRLAFFDANYRKSEPIENSLRENIEIAQRFELGPIVEAWTSLKRYYEDLIPDHTAAPETQAPKQRFVFAETKDKPAAGDGTECLRQIVDFYSKKEDNRFAAIDPNEIFFNEGKIFVHNDLESRFKSHNKKKIGLFYSEKRNLFPRLAEEIVTGVIESGEFVHGFAMYRLLKAYMSSTPRQVMENWEMNYFQVLKQSQLHQQAAEMALHSGFERVKDLMAEARVFDIKCPHCGTLIEKADNRECSKCKRVLECAFCKKEAAGLVMVCPQCGHGGHLKELVSHFSNNPEAMCPLGCDHRCFTFD